MTDGVDPAEEPEQPADGDPPWLTVRRAEVALALSIAVDRRSPTC